MNGIAIFDLDDTLVKTDTKVYKRKDGKEIEMNSEEFAKDSDKGKEGVEYDFRDFRDPKRIRAGILNGKPIIKNLHLLDKYAQKGYDIAFLTARANEDDIYKALQQFLKVRNENGKLEPIMGRLSRELSVAIDDPKYDGYFEAESHSDKKAEVLNDYCDVFDHVVFVDDDINNLRSAKSLHRDNLTVIKA